jgi:hypothetical protein
MNVLLYAIHHYHQQLIQPIVYNIWHKLLNAISLALVCIVTWWLYLCLFKGKLPGPPRHFELLSINTTSVLLAWDAPSQTPTVDHYLVELIPIPGTRVLSVGI